jgi:DNA-binding MarR family transcriptional regulator
MDSPPKTADPLILKDFLPYRLHIAAEQVSLAFSAIYKDKYGLTRPEWRVLAILGQMPKTTATIIGVHSKLHKTKVSRAVFALEKRKWLVRAIDENDRRIEWLKLTKTGRIEFAALSVLARKFEFELLEVLGAKASMQLVAALDRIESTKLPNT